MLITPDLWSRFKQNLALFGLPGQVPIQPNHPPVGVCPDCCGVPTTPGISAQFDNGGDRCCA